MHQLLLHEALTFDPQSPQRSRVTSVIQWDIRLPPTLARLSGSPRHSRTGLPPHVLSQHATSPPIPFFKITSGILPDQWTIEIRNESGVTVGDVLDGLFCGFRHRVASKEWACAPRSHQVRVAEAWHSRCELVREKNGEGKKGEQKRKYEEKAGVRRVDWFVRSTSFVGLTSSVEMAHTWTLALKRAKK